MLLKGPSPGTMKFREIPLTALPDAGLIPGCGMLSSLRLSTQHILLFSQYRNTISLCHFTHVKAVSMSEYSISTYQLSGFLIERLEMGLNAWEEIINHRYMLFPWEGMDLVLLFTSIFEYFTLTFSQKLTISYTFLVKMSFLCYSGGHHSLIGGNQFLAYIYFSCSYATARDGMAHASFPEEGQRVTPDGEDMVECRILSTLCPHYQVQGTG